jgi:hypothetical protein
MTILPTFAALAPISLSGVSPLFSKGRPFHKPLIQTALQLAGSGFVYWFCYRLATANPTSRGIAFAA